MLIQPRRAARPKIVVADSVRLMQNPQKRHVRRVHSIGSEVHLPARVGVGILSDAGNFECRSASRCGRSLSQERTMRDCQIGYYREHELIHTSGIHPSSPLNEYLDWQTFPRCLPLDFSAAFPLILHHCGD